MNRGSNGTRFKVCSTKVQSLRSVGLPREPSAADAVSDRAVVWLKKKNRPAEPPEGVRVTCKEGDEDAGEVAAGAWKTVPKQFAKTSPLPFPRRHLLRRCRAGRIDELVLPGVLPDPLSQRRALRCPAISVATEAAGPRWDLGALVRRSQACKCPRGSPGAVPGGRWPSGPSNKKCHPPDSSLSPAAAAGRSVRPPARRPAAAAAGGAG